MFHWYGLIVGIAVVVWWSIVERLEPKLKKIVPIMLLLALIGARSYHIFEYWQYYQGNVKAMFSLWAGGLSIWGALILGGGYVLLVARSMVWAVVTPLPLAQAIGRLGNFVNGEFTRPVLGIPWWGMEAIMDLVLFGIIWNVKKEWRAGIFVVGYGLIRLVLAPYR